jgi:hypothetical protein
MVTGNVNNLAGLIENKNMVCEDVIFLWTLPDIHNFVPLDSRDILTQWIQWGFTQIIWFLCVNNKRYASRKNGVIAFGYNAESGESPD